MNKTELLSTYTAERLAEMVENLQKENLVELLKLKNREDTEDVSKVLDAMKLTITELCNTIEDLQGENIQEKQKHAKTLWEYCDSVKKEDYEKEVNRLQSEVNHYRKAFENAKKERDCQIAEYQKKIEELTAENEKLKGGINGVDCKENGENKNNFYDIFSYHARNLTKDGLLMFLGILTKELVENGIDFRYEMEKELKVWDIKIKRDKDIADFLPTEPIKVADMLINELEKKKTSEAKNKRKENENKGIFCLHGFDEKKKRATSELKQIAKHLLVYCNANGEVEE